jgi:dTDP-4-amino-4,6-dideoxygalactose transaminase
MNLPLVDLKSQYESIRDEIDRAIGEVISSSAFIGGPFVGRFEKSFARYCGVSHCVGVGNGTDALRIALQALGVGPGDEVITTALSFIATSEAVTMAGAKVVFADIDRNTYNIDPEKIEGKITAATKAIVPVHLYGQPADMDPILKIAKKHGLRVIEDAAQAHGAEYRGRRVGSMGDMACFSFYPGKNLGAYGDGGAIVTNDETLALKARMFANHGRIDKYDHELEGVNSRLDGLQAAVLDAKLKHLEEWTEKRRRNVRLYNEGLRGSGLATPFEIEAVRAVYHLYVVRVGNGRRREFQDHLKSKGVATGIHYPIALPNLKAYRYLNHAASDFPEATRASQEVVSLPLFPELTEEQIRYVCGAVLGFPR